MEALYGSGNWRLTVRRGEDGITILRALTCDAEAVLPDELWGLPVIALADRCLAPNAPVVEGERLTIRSSREDGEWDNRGIRSLTLPKSLLRVGQYAFFNCASLCSVTLWDDVQDFAASAFMNCRDFGSIRLIRTGDRQGAVLWSIVSRLSRELDVTIESSAGTARLIFPEYYEDFTENEPTHFFNYNIRSAGFPYHNVFADKKLSLRAFDSLWGKLLTVEHDDASAVKLAWLRLRYPVELGAEAEQAYSEYIRAHSLAAAELTLEMRDLSGLHMLLGRFSLTEEELRQLRLISGNMHYTEATALLLEALHKYEPRGRRRSYAL